MREAGFGKERCGPFVGEFIGGFRIGQRIKQFAFGEIGGFEASKARCRRSGYSP